MSGAKNVKTVERNTFVFDDNGLRHHILAGTKLEGDMAWAADKITNDKVFRKPEGAEIGEQDAVEPAPNQPTLAPTATITPPPRTGAGSGKDAWVEYFNKVTPDGVDLEGNETRDDIIQWLDENHFLDHGPTES